MIPTYNRADFLDYSLEVHIPMVKQYNIEICIFDNASTDNTCEVVLKWMKEYAFLTYHKNEINIGPDANFERALKYPQTNYVWLLGDTYQLESGTIEYIMELIKNDCFDHILINVGNEIKDIKTQVYQDQNKLLEDLFWLMTCLSVHIYSHSLIKEANFSRYRNSNFIQTGIIFEYIDNRDFKVFWNSQHSVKRVSSINGTLKDLWINNYFEIWLKNRINVIMSLPPSYKIFIKFNSIKYDGYNRKQVNIKTLLYYRIENILNYDKVVENKLLLLLIGSYPTYLISLFIAIIPINFLRFLKMVYKSLKKMISC